MRIAWAPLLLASLGGACGGSALDRPVAQFPSKEELARVAGRRAQVAPSLPAAAVDQWQIETPVPAPGSPYPNESAWDRMMVAARATRHSSMRLAPELRCAATETARFYVKNGGHPEDALREYLLLRCGSTLATATVRTLTNQIADDVPDGRVEANFAPQAQELIVAQLSSGTEMGLGFARGSGRAALVAFAGTPLGRVRDIPALVTGDRITLEGEVASDSATVLGLANQGVLGVAPCESDPSVRLPAFRVSCPIATGDPQTRIQIIVRKPDEVLMRQSTQLMVRRSPEAGLVYEPRAYGSRDPAATADAFRKGIVDGLNEARGQAGVRPLRLETNQSRDSDQVVGHYFESANGGDAHDADTVALGLLAGWDVEGTIRDGGMYSAVISASRSPSRWLTHALDSPTGRWALLEPNMARIAVGVEFGQATGAMALATTYAFFESLDHRADEDAVFERLAGVRKARRLAPPRRVANHGALQAALSQVAANAVSSSAALQAAMERVAGTQGRGVRGWVVETNDLRNFPFDKVLLASGPLEVQVGVTHHRATGGAWGQYSVLFMMFDDSVPSVTAGRSRKTRNL